MHPNLTIAGLGCRAGSGEEWADEENAMTVAKHWRSSGQQAVTAWGDTFTTSLRCGFLSMSAGSQSIWMSPGGSEGFFRDMSEPARSLGLPEHAVNYGEVDMDHAIRKGREHGISFLTPDEIRQQMLPLATVDRQFNRGQIPRLP